MFTFPHISLAVLAKAPVLGKAKTRMQPHFSETFSLNLHKKLLDFTLQQHLNSKLCPLQLWLAGDQQDFVQQLPQWSHLSPAQQQEGDLGERMLAIVQSQLQQSQGVILIGSDCPFIDAAYIKQACEQLQQHDVVIGPASDGGYVLLGLRAQQQALFREISWGEETVFEQTREKIHSLGLSLAILPELHDIDRPEDIETLQALPFFADFLRENV